MTGWVVRGEVWWGLWGGDCWGVRWLDYGLICLCLVDCCHSHQLPSSQQSPVSPGRPSGPLNTYQAHPLLTSASSASESTRLHAEWKKV